jgi:hypothetical protein
MDVCTVLSGRMGGVRDLPWVLLPVLKILTLRGYQGLFSAGSTSMSTPVAYCTHRLPDVHDRLIMHGGVCRACHHSLRTTCQLSRRR